MAYYGSQLPNNLGAGLEVWNTLRPGGTAEQQKAQIAATQAGTEAAKAGTEAAKAQTAFSQTENQKAQFELGNAKNLFSGLTSYQGGYEQPFFQKSPDQQNDFLSHIQQSGFQGDPSQAIAAHDSLYQSRNLPNQALLPYLFAQNEGVDFGGVKPPGGAQPQPAAQPLPDVQLPALSAPPLGGWDITGGLPVGSASGAASPAGLGAPAPQSAPPAAPAPGPAPAAAVPAAAGPQVSPDAVLPDQFFKPQLGVVWEGGAPRLGQTGGLNAAQSQYVIARVLKGLQTGHAGYFGNASRFQTPETRKAAQDLESQITSGWNVHNESFKWASDRLAAQPAYQEYVGSGEKAGFLSNWNDMNAIRQRYAAQRPDGSWDWNLKGNAIVSNSDAVALLDKQIKSDSPGATLKNFMAEEMEKGGSKAQNTFAKFVSMAQGGTAIPVRVLRDITETMDNLKAAKENSVFKVMRQLEPELQSRGIPLGVVADPDAVEEFYRRNGQIVDDTGAAIQLARQGVPFRPTAKVAAQLSQQTGKNIAPYAVTSNQAAPSKPAPPRGPGAPSQLPDVTLDAPQPPASARQLPPPRGRMGWVSPQTASPIKRTVKPPNMQDLLRLGGAYAAPTH